jgi:hypothetical protein
MLLVRRLPIYDRASINGGPLNAEDWASGGEKRPLDRSKQWL